MTSAVTNASRTCDQCNIPADQTNNGRLQICGECRAVAYCSQKCQIEAAPSHKSSCKLASQMLKMKNEQKDLPSGSRPNLKSALKIDNPLSSSPENNTPSKVDEFSQSGCSVLRKSAQTTTDPEQKKISEAAPSAYETRGPEKMVATGLAWRSINYYQLSLALGAFPKEEVQPELLSLERIKGRLEDPETLREDLFELHSISRRFTELILK